MITLNKKKHHSLFVTSFRWIGGIGIRTVLKIMPKIKYTKDILELLCKESYCVSEVCRKLNMSPNGGHHSSIKKKIIEYDIDISHFDYNRYIKLNRLKDIPRLSSNDVLVFNRRSGRREASKRLRRALIESGIDYKCSECGCIDTWNEKSLTLHVDHIDGNPLNNRKNNLRFLCPNCHSQTSNYCSLNISNKNKPVHFTINRNNKVIPVFKECEICKKPINKKSKRCIRCNNIGRKKNKSYFKIEWPCLDELEALVWKYPTSQLSKILGVSDSAIGKRCNRLGIKKPHRGYWTKINIKTTY